MQMLRQAAALWKEARKRSGSTLQRRLILFFALVTVSIILLFALLLMLFGITGSGRHTVQSYTETELQHFYDAASTDMGNLSMAGIDLAQRLSNGCKVFFEENDINGAQLAEHPELIEPLLAAQMPLLLSVSENNTCGGVFILLDATVNPAREDAASHRAGIFIKKTQPISSASLATKNYLLRGPASAARSYGVELLGQWQMEYDLTGHEYIQSLMETARDNPELPLSRLYYWSGRVCLHGNSEEGFLLFVPLRLEDGAVLGVCGIEVSDRMFKQLYSPKEGAYQAVFAIAAPSEGAVLCADRGMLAGNAYLTGNNLTSSLSAEGEDSGFQLWGDGSASYGGLSKTIKVYPSGSPYVDETWTAAILMPRQTLSAAIKGISLYLYGIMLVLLVASIGASILISRKYLQPLKQMFDRVQSDTYDEEDASGVVEIDDFFNFIAQRTKQHQEELALLEQDKREAEIRYEQVRTDVSRITGAKKEEIDMDGYRLFLESLHTLTPREREIFDFYLEGCSTKVVLERTGFSERTLKFHNSNIYSKLGVPSRKKLLQFAAIMKNDRIAEGGSDKA